MPLDIKEIFRSDLDPNNPTYWWSSKKIEKLNWNFDQIELIGGGPLGPSGFAGVIGPDGVTGNQGPTGRQGSKGRQGSQGPMGETNWLANIGTNNITLKIPQSTDHPSNVILGLDNTKPGYNLVAAASSTAAVKTFHTDDPLQNNFVFITPEIDGNNTDLSTRKQVFGNLYYDVTHSKFDFGFEHVTNPREFIFKTSNITGGEVSFKTRNISNTPMFKLDVSGVTVNRNSTFNSLASLNGVNKFMNDSPAAGYVAYTEASDVGRVRWGDPGDIIGGFPIGSIIAIDREFITENFDLVDTSVSGTLTLLEQGAVTGSGSTVPTFVFTYGRGKDKFKGWYLCHGRSWYKGALSYDIPNLCSFDLMVDYPVGSSQVAQLLQTTNNRPILSSAVLKFVASLSGSTYTFSNGTSGTNVLESYVDGFNEFPTGNASESNLYAGDSPATNNTGLELKMGLVNGLVYLVYLGEEGMVWNTAGAVLSLNDIDAGYDASSVSSACNATETSYKTDFVASWTETNNWSTTGYKLYNSAGSAWAPSGYYEKFGIVRQWNGSTGVFTSRQACPSYTSIQLAYNIAVNSGSLNGSFSSLSKSTYYINGTALGNSTSIYTNSTGTSLATAGWYRDSSVRRYWDGSAFEGSAPTLDYVRYLSGLSWSSTGSGACNGDYYTEGYYQSSSSTLLSFTTTSMLFDSYSADGESPLVFAQQGRYYSDMLGLNRRQGTNSNTGALGSVVSCYSSGPPSNNTSCLLYGTKILMADGSNKFIQDLKINDNLYSLKVEGMPIRDYPSVYEWSSKSLNMLKDNVIVKSISSINTNTVYSINDGKLFATEDHLHLYKHSNLWKVGKTYDLLEGDFLIDKDGNEIEIFNIIKISGSFIVYKLDVEDNDLFVANGILTHNKEPRVE